MLYPYHKKFYNGVFKWHTLEFVCAHHNPFFTMITSHKLSLIYVPRMHIARTCKEGTGQVDGNGGVRVLKCISTSSDARCQRVYLVGKVSGYCRLFVLKIFILNLLYS